MEFSISQNNATKIDETIFFRKFLTSGSMLLIMQNFKKLVFLYDLWQKIIFPQRRKDIKKQSLPLQLCFLAPLREIFSVFPCNLRKKHF
jgi:hypothetical protein